MFDPSKLNLDLDEENKVSKKQSPEEIKAELEKVEASFSDQELLKEEEKKQENIQKNEEKDILLDVENKFIEKDLQKLEEYKKEKEKQKKQEEKEQEEVVGDVSGIIEENKRQKIDVKENSLIDINIKSLEDILKIMLQNSSNTFVFEPRDNDVKIIFREDKIQKDIKYIKFPVYNKILLKVKALTKMKVEEVNIWQEWKWELQFKDNKYAIISKTVPSAFGEKLFFKFKKIEKKIIPKSKQKTSIGTLVWFLSAIAIVALIIGWAFISFIVMNAKTLEDVKFFYNLWINLNDINTFIEKTVNVIFGILIFIETIFLAIFGFKAILTKKIYKRKKISYTIFAIFLLVLAFSSWSAWMYINKKIAALPNWQVMAQWDVIIYDNSKLISGNFSKKQTIMRDTSSLIGPVTLKFDLSSFEYRQKQKWFKVKKYIWSFWWKKEAPKKTPSIIKTFDKIKTYDVKVDVIWINRKWEEETKTINNIKSIEISNLVNITEKINDLWIKTVSFDASDLKQLWEIQWNIVEKKGDKFKIIPVYKWYNFIPPAIKKDTIFAMQILKEAKKSQKLDKIFIIKKPEQANIKWKIVYKQDVINDFKYTFSVKNPKTNFWDWFIESFVWHIGDENIKREAWFDNLEEDSKITHIFKNYWKHKIIVELKNSKWKIKKLETFINISKRLKIKSKFWLKIYNDWILMDKNEAKYDAKNKEYYIRDLAVPTKLKFDTRLIRSEDILYKLDSVSWDINDDGVFDKTTKVLELPIDTAWNKTIIAKYKFVNRKIKEKVSYITERIYIDSVKKDAILRLKITPKDRYVPTFVKFDASLTQIKWKNIEKFIYDYWDWTPPDERDAVNPAHRYNVAGEYNIKLTVVTTDWSKYSITKKLVLKPKPQKAKITLSMKNAPVNQEIDFSSEDSQWQIKSYFWDFGDWDVSTDANPSHSYEIAWKYDVKLKLTFKNNNELEDTQQITITDF